MSRNEHRTEADKLLGDAIDHAADGQHWLAEFALGRAHVHALLALSARDTTTETRVAYSSGGAS